MPFHRICNEKTDKVQVLHSIEWQETGGLVQVTALYSAHLVSGV